MLLVRYGVNSANDSLSKNSFRLHTHSHVHLKSYLTVFCLLKSRSLICHHNLDHGEMLHRCFFSLQLHNNMQIAIIGTLVILSKKYNRSNCMISSMWGLYLSAKRA